MNKELVLELLQISLNEYLSGELIASRLLISRQSVSNIIKSLKKDGYSIDSISNKGHCLSNNDNRIMPYYIKNNLLYNTDIRYFDKIDSTNNYAKQIVIDGLNDNTLVISNEQSKGRGRYNKVFESNKDVSVYLSLILKTKDNPLITDFLTCLAAISIVRCINELVNIKVDIKWVNDILYKGKKLSGILCEANFDYESKCIDYVIVGMGINLNNTCFSNIDDIATSLKIISNNNMDRNLFVVSLINIFYDYYYNYSVEEIMSLYKDSSIILNKVVTFKINNNKYEGLVEKINDNGSLLIKTSNDYLTINSGDVSIRGYYE